MEILPDNHCNKWTVNETNKLINEIKNKTPIYIIANNHKRTVGAIKFKIIRYAMELLEKKIIESKLNDIEEITNLSKKDLINIEEDLLISTLKSMNNNLRFILIIQFFLICLQFANSSI